MHGSVCLLSKYFQHFLNGESNEKLETDENDISSNWKGTCNLITFFEKVKNNYSTYINNLNSIINSEVCSNNIVCHKDTIDYFNKTKNSILELSNISTLNSKRPSELNNPITPYFELEFQNLSNISSLGGKIYSDLKNKLEYHINQDEYLVNELKNYFEKNSNNFSNFLEMAFNNFSLFDKTVATSSSVILNNFLSDNKIILDSYQFIFIFLTSAYLVILTAVFIILIIYESEKYKKLHLALMVLINLLFAMNILELVLSGYFLGIRTFSHNTARVMKYIFTEDYIISGNSGEYPPKFGNYDQMQINFFKNCLNDNGDLSNIFFTESYLNDLVTNINTMRNVSLIYYNNISTIIDNSFITINNYDTLNMSSILIKTITEFEEMKNDLYIASSEYFGVDDIQTIITNIRKNLTSSTSCNMTKEYFVIKEKDCPNYSIVSTKILTDDDINHCYIIQNLESNTVTYNGCNTTYINLAITFIKEVNTLLNTKINKLKEIQNNYAQTWNNIYNEFESINNNLNNLYGILNDNFINGYNNVVNCSSVRFDLIDFAEFFGEKTYYDINIIAIFSSLAGTIGYALLYCILMIINNIKTYKKGILYENDYIYNDNNKSKIDNRNFLNNNFNNNQSRYKNIKPPKFLMRDSLVNDEQRLSNNKSRFSRDKLIDISGETDFNRSKRNLIDTSKTSNINIEMGFLNNRKNKKENVRNYYNNNE